jgi:hypothetical protein
MNKAFMIKHKNILITLALLVLIMGCSLFKPNEEKGLGSVEHAVISAVLDSIIHQYPRETIDVYDQTTTAINSASLFIAFERDSINSDSLLANYSDANQIHYALNIDKLPSYVMLKDTDESELFTGYTAFTRPGISDNGLMAVAEYSSVSAPLAGCGMAAVLEKHGETWRVIWIKTIQLPHK